MDTGWRDDGDWLSMAKLPGKPPEASEESKENSVRVLGDNMTHKQLLSDFSFPELWNSNFVAAKPLHSAAVGKCG